MYRNSLSQAIKNAFLAIIMAVSVLYTIATTIAALFSVTHVWTLKQSALEIAIVALAFAIVASFSSYGFYHSVISIKALAKYLEKRNFVLVLKKGGLTASKNDIEIEVKLDRPFMDYWPVPRTVIIKNNGKSEFSKKGSWDPRYMYHLGRLSIQKTLRPGTTLPQLETVLDKYQDKSLLGEISNSNGLLRIELRMGSWMGADLFGIMDDVLQALNI